MFATERKRLIKKYLVENHKVSVSELSSLLDVSEVTIRRDLEKLEQENILVRTHGGAILKDDDSFTTLPISEMNDKKQKITLLQEIASFAYDLVQDGDIVMLTEGNINVHIAKKLKQKNNLTVLTNNLLVAFEFSNSNTNHLILLGGDLFGNALYGQLTFNNLKHFSINQIFIEADGASLKNGFSVNSINKASFIQSACQCASNVILVCLGSSFGKDSFYRLGPLSFPNQILTNATLPDEYKQHFFNLNIPLYTSIDLYQP